jgi:Bax protein
LKRTDFDRLRERVDAVPPSLALAQAAIESGWGGSRFAQSGNALFGQWTWKGQGIVPSRRNAGASHKIKSFGHLMEAVWGYVNNLNSHRAYRGLRERRLALSAAGRRLSGAELAGALAQYSERGDAYIGDLLSIIRQNGLEAFDSASLENSGSQQRAFARR